MRGGTGEEREERLEVLLQTRHRPWCHRLPHELLARRYEKASLILASSKSFVDWGEIFNDQVLATAILDRLLHHATTLNIKGESYRLKEKRKAGLLSSAPGPKEVVPTTN